MKKTMLSLLMVAGLVSAAQAAACPEGNYDGCSSEGYSIVEVEPVTYWAHNHMEAAHITAHRSRSHHCRVHRPLRCCVR